MHLHTTTIQFPEINLQTRDAHKLRGYFGNLFKEKSELLHNHYADGESKYKYPLVQYKVIENIPMLIGINDGGKLLMDLFLKINEIRIENMVYEVNSKNITNTVTQIENFDTLKEYRFETLWMALNQDNHAKYLQIDLQEQRNAFLNKLLQNNLLSFYKGVGYRADARIMVSAKLTENQTAFKDKAMLAFAGSFVTNAVLPDYVGIGKSTSRGFGSIKKIG